MTRTDEWGPLVPIDEDRLWALIQLSARWTVKSLGDHLKEAGIPTARQQRLDQLTKNPLLLNKKPQQRCRKVFRDALADCLGVPSLWLGGEMRHLPEQNIRTVMAAFSDTLDGRDPLFIVFGMIPRGLLSIEAIVNRNPTVMVRLLTDETGAA